MHRSVGIECMVSPVTAQHSTEGQKGFCTLRGQMQISMGIGFAMTFLDLRVAALHS
jgi:hypothetical protein